MWCICEFLMEGRYSFFLTLITDWSMLAYFENNAQQVTVFSLFFLWYLLCSESVESFYSLFLFPSVFLTEHWNGCVILHYSYCLKRTCITLYRHIVQQL